MYNYNYIVFNTVGSQYSLPNRDSYYSICLEELEESEEIKVVPLPLYEQPKIVRIIYAIHNAHRLKKYINIPFKKIWYPLFFKNTFENDKPFCFVLFNHKLPISYLEFLKNKYPNCKIVLMHRDFMKVSNALNDSIAQNPILDLEMTYDEGEAKKYGFPHFSEFESKVDIPIEKQFESDVFFAGKAKDRLPELMKAYNKLTENGLKVYFFLTGVPQELQIPHPGIEYASRFMTYREMLYHTVNTRCVLEAVQGGGQSGFTSRFLEAIIYGKKLITNHEYTRESKFYDPAKIQIVDTMDKIDVDFIKRGTGKVDYKYNGEFSPFRMIEKVEEELNKRYR